MTLFQKTTSSSIKKFLKQILPLGDRTMAYIRFLTRPGVSLAALLLLSALIGSIVVSEVGRLKHERVWLNHTYAVLDDMDDLLLFLTQAESLQRRYTIYPDDTVLTAYQKLIAAKGNSVPDATIRSQLKKLRLLTADSPVQQERVNALEGLIDRKIDFMQQMIAFSPGKSREEIHAFAHDRGSNLMGEIQSIFSTMEKEENNLLKVRQEDEGRLAEGVMLTGSILILLLVVILGYAFFTTQRGLVRRQHAEKILRKTIAFQDALLREAPYAIIAADPAGKITLFNPAAEAMLGYKAEEMVGKADPETFHDKAEIEARAFELSEELGYSVEPGIDVFTLKPRLSGPESREWTYYHKDGHTIPVRVIVTVIPDGHGGIAGYFGMAEDITERKQIERMKNEFVSTVSHELRTPLTSIRGSLGLILADVAGDMADKVRELIGIAYTNSERLVRLINDILNIEKIESGTIVIDLVSLPAGPLLEQAIRENEGYAEKYAIKLVSRNEAGNTPVMTSQDHLLQIFSNLLSNAMKFSPTGGTVTLASKVYSDKIRFMVTDNGSGIPEDFQNRIFEKFSQADSSDSRAKSGTGLGLSISKVLIEKMNGVIGFISRPGRTTFYVDLPRASALPAVAEAKDAKLKEVPVSKRVLIVEDDQDVASLLGIILTQEGLDCIFASTAAEAKELLTLGTYTAMTLDLCLPDKDGLMLIQELRADPRTVDLPIIVISINAEDVRKILNGHAIGILDWLQKPIDINRLKRTLRTVAAVDRIPSIIHVEDDADMAEVIALSLAGKASITHAATIAEALDYLERTSFDLAILDMKLPDGSGLDLLPVLTDQIPLIPVIILSASETPREIRNQVKSSLVKSVVSEEKIVRIIQDAIQGGVI